MESTKLDIRTLELEEIKSFLTEKNEKAFRAKQINEWLWVKGVRSFDEMTNLSFPLRALLNEHFVINGLEEDFVQCSADGTIKSRFRLKDGNLIESVLIPVERDKRFTVCLSTQYGCSLSCKFCATGQMPNMRNLEAGEIFDQFMMVNAQCIETYGVPLTNIVFMGMGEPLLNYKNTLKAIEKISDPQGFNFSQRRMTLSTAGIAKMIKRLGDDQARFNLALSLHAADDAKRDAIMPINEHNNLEVLMEAIQYFYDQTGNKISFEYIAFKNYNEGMEDAKNLAKLCRSFPVKVNIIEYNPIEGLPFQRPEGTTIDDFARQLHDLGVAVTVRRSRGKDIDAACGQLANK